MSRLRVTKLFFIYGVPVKIARFSNIYGSGDPNWSRLFPNNIRRILEGLPPIVYTTAGEYVREFIYIADAISAFKTISNHGSPGEIYCVGSSDVFEIQELIEKNINFCDSDLSIDYIKKIATFKEVQKQYVDTTKLKKLGWKAKVSFEKGIKKTVDYYRTQLALKNSPPTIGQKIKK